MPLVSTDIRSYKSANADSDGGGIDLTREITSGVDNNLFPDITGTEQVAGGTRYRKFFRRNQHATLTWNTVKSWIQTQPSNATISLGVGIDDVSDNDGLQGNMTAWTATAVAAIVSDGADTRVVTVVGETAAGLYQTENITLNSTTEVAGALSFGKVYHAFAASLSATRTVTLRQGAGGPSRGSIGPNKKITFLWRTGTDIDTEAEGYRHGNIAALANFGLWLRKVWPANATAGTGFSTTITSAGASP